MTRYLYGGSPADFTTTARGHIEPNVTVTVWTEQVGGVQVTDLLTVEETPCASVNSGDAGGPVQFYAEDGMRESLWLDSGMGSRLLIRPVNLPTAEFEIGTVTTGSPAAAHIDGNLEDGYTLDLTLPSVGAGSIHDANVNAAADIGRTKIAGTALTQASTGVFSVLDFGAVGDGTTDDTAAIEATITAAGVGGAVFFPRGIYVASRTLWPLDRQVWRGEHTPSYWASTSEMLTSCAIKATAGAFTGRALIERASPARGVGFYNLSFVGKGDEHATELHGIHLGDSSGERGWMLDTCTIHGFSGRGITGRLHVFDLRDSHIARCGWGVRLVEKNASDCRIIGCQVYYCKDGGIGFESSDRSGAITIEATRVERCGNTFGDVANPRNAYAPGFRLNHCNNIYLVNCSTDANTGPGLEVAPPLGKYSYSISVVASQFTRDGGGAMLGTEQIPGVKIVKGAHVGFVGSHIGWGDPDDGGSTPEIIVPYHGMWVEDAVSVVTSVSRIEAAPDAGDDIHEVGSNYNCSLNLPVGLVADGKAGTGRFAKFQTEGLDRWTVGASQAAESGSNLGSDLTFARYDDSGAFVENVLMIRRDTGDIVLGNLYFQDGKTISNVASLDVDDDLEAPRIRLNGVAGKSKFVFFRTDLKSRWSLGADTAAESGSNAGSNFVLSRYDDLGGFIDNPLLIDRDDGTLTLNSVWFKNGATISNVAAVDVDATDNLSRIPLDIEVDPAHAAYWARVRNTAGLQPFAITYDGRVQVNWADGRYKAVQQGSTQVVREGAGSGNTLLACYTSVANAGSGNSVFEVYGDGTVQIADGTSLNNAITKGQVKTIVAASTDFADFKARMAAW